MGLFGKGKSAEKELHPKDCVVRLCRFCKEPMELTAYEFSDFNTREYDFHCNNCGLDTELSEDMDKSALIGLDAYSPEPLTKEEIDEMKEDLKD